MSITIADAKILLGERLVEGSISVQDGRISRIGKTAHLPKAQTIIDAKGLIAIPGLIDAHVHLRDMELAYKEDFSSGTLAAAAGGFTTILDMPNTKPPTDSEQRLLEKMGKARTAINVNVGFYATLAESPDEIRRMVHAGVIGFKLYMNDPNPEAWHHNQQRLIMSLRECRSLRALVACHAENGLAIAKIQEKLQASGRNSIRDFLRAHAPRFEVEAVRMITNLARHAHSRVHICHLSTRQALGEISKARKAGGALTCEVTPHHLLLNRKDLNQKERLALMVPPLRGPEDTTALWKAVLRKRVDVVASDHAPHTLEEKTTSSVWTVRTGIPGLETTLPLLLTKVHRREIKLSRLVQVLSENPARIFRLSTKGKLAAGMDGDVVLIDPTERFKVDSSKFYSKAHFSPFDGVDCVGRAVMTIISGHIIYDRGAIVERNCGKIITPRVKP